MIMNKLQLKNTAVLRDWKLIFDFNAKGEFYFLTGCIYEDSRNHCLDGQKIRTSILINIDFKNMKAETQNTIYELKGMTTI